MTIGLDGCQYSGQSAEGEVWYQETRAYLVQDVWGVDTGDGGVLLWDVDDGPARV